MKLAIGRGVKEDQYSYLSFFVKLLDDLITIILKLFKELKELKGGNETETTSSETAEG